MVFRSLDADAFVADKPLSSAHMSYLRDSVAACRSARMRAASVGWDVRSGRAPILSGVGSSEDGSQRGVVFLAWRKRRSTVTEITVRARGYNPSGESVWIGAFIADPNVMIRPGGRVPPTTDNQIEVTATSSSAQDLSWSLDVTGLPLGVHLIGLAAMSDYGDPEVLYYNPGGGEQTGLSELHFNNMGITLLNTASWDGSTALSEGFAPYRIRLGQAITGGNFDHTAFTTDTSDRTVGNESSPLPDPQHLLSQRSTSIGTGDALYVWPGIPEDFGVGSLDAIAREEMGYLELHSIHVEETDGVDFDPGALAFATAVPASAARAQSLFQELEDVFVLQDGPIAIGLRPSEIEDSGFGSPLHKGGMTACPITKDSTGWNTLMTWMVGGPREAFRDEDAVSSTTRNKYQVDAFVVWLTRRQDWVQSSGDVLFRLVLTDGDGSSDAVTGAEVPYPMASSVYAATGQGARVAGDPLASQGYLLGLRQGAVEVNHNLRDQWPESIVPNLNTTQVTVWVEDTGDTSATVPRVLKLQCAIDPLGLQNFSTTANVSSMTCIAALVDVVESNDPGTLGG